jgi:hypothetical protein
MLLTTAAKPNRVLGASPALARYAHSRRKRAIDASELVALDIATRHLARANTPISGENWGR